MKVIDKNIGSFRNFLWFGVSMPKESPIDSYSNDFYILPGLWFRRRPHNEFEVGFQWLIFYVRYYRFKNLKMQ